MRTMQQHPAGQEAGIELGSGPGAPRRARHYVTGVLRALRAPQDVTEAAELITSELVTNSVKYGRACRVRVTVKVAGGTATITVSDSTPYVPLPVVGAVGEEDENGRGLLLVEALAARWGHRCAGTEPDDGTAVWAELPPWETELPLPAPPPPQPHVPKRLAHQGRWGRTRPDS